MVLNTGHATGWKARDFALQGIDGKIYPLAEVRGPKGTLLVFICNHCPYVKASINRIVAETNALRGIGIGTIAIMHRGLSRGLLRQHEGENKPKVVELVGALGFEVVDAGPLRNARLLEAHAMLWIDLALNRGLGRDFAFALLRR